MTRAWADSRQPPRPQACATERKHGYASPSQSAVRFARFSPAARKAAAVTTPTVDLIDGDKLCNLVRDQQVGLRIVTQVDEDWFDRFDA